MPALIGGTKFYQVALLGRIDERAKHFEKLISQGLEDLGVGGAAQFIREEDLSQIDPKFPCVAAFFGYENAQDEKHPGIGKLINDSIVVIPVVSDVEVVASEIPQSLRHINAIDLGSRDAGLSRAASLVLECFRLLRRERRLFISYRRVDSRAAAEQLYDVLDDRGFDVFIDTKSVPPGADFQAELWHRLSDSDVVILIDTPGFRASRWTTEELARANATNIQILHLLWPGQSEDRSSSFSHFLQLRDGDFIKRAKKPHMRKLRRNTLLSVCALAESLRARAIAARHRYLVDNFCDSAREMGFAPSVQPQRWISLPLRSGEEIAVVPTIGVPTADRINDIVESISSGRASGGVWVLFDSRGLLPKWLEHLKWLGDYLPAKSIHVAKVGDSLAELL